MKSETNKAAASVEAIAAMPSVAASLVSTATADATDAARAAVGAAPAPASPAAPAPAADAAPEATEESLAARELAYQVLHALLSQPPTRGNVEVALSDVFAQALELVGATGAANAAGAADASNTAAELAQQRAAFERDPEGYTRAAADEYQRLFYAPGRLAAPPWESSWRCAERKVFQRSTLEVRDAYRAQGFRPVGVNRIPDDHVSIELCFMAQLANRAKDAVAERALEEPNAANRPTPASPTPYAQVPQAPRPCEPAAAAPSALAASQAFLANHLGCWADDYATALAQASGTGFYAYIARCLRKLVRADARWLDQHISHAGAAGNPPAQQATSNRPAQAPSPAVLAS